MTCFIARLKVKPGREADFERLQQELSELTHAAGARHTTVTTSSVIALSRGVYVVYARFKDEAAFQLHQTTSFHDRLVPPIVDTLAGEMDLQFFDWIS